jgi:hypothetical protein
LTPLPLQLIGWMYTLVCAIALLVGAWLVIGCTSRALMRASNSPSRVIDDAVLFGIWILDWQAASASSSARAGALSCSSFSAGC